MKKTGYVTIAGQTNVGKSTLLNGFMGRKMSIISDKPETTRDNIISIFEDEDSIITFSDTPGIHRPHDLLGKIMLTRAKSSLFEADIILFITEKKLIFSQEDMNIISFFPREKEKKTVILVINKIDKIKNKRTLLPLMEKTKKIYPFDAIIPVCALAKKDVAYVLDVIKSYLLKKTSSDRTYPGENATIEFTIKELIREKILQITRQEVPHSTAVIVDKISDDGHILRIHASIVIERISQRSILVGKNGAMIKKIGTLARKDLEKTLSKRVFLDLWVKVISGWKKDTDALREIGYQ